MKCFVLIITAMFAGARLAGVIMWPWWLVFAPLIIYYGVWVAIFVLGMIISLIWMLIDCLKHK